MLSRMDVSGRVLTSKAHGECSSVAASGVAMAVQESETSGGRFMGIDHWHK